jgi:hypothetical protein
MHVFAHAIPSLDFDGNLHIMQCKYIEAPVYSDVPRLALMLGKRYKVGF